MSSPSQPKIQRGEVWDLKFDPQVGSEIGKIRPAVMMNIPSVGRLPLHIVVPITTGHANFSKLFWMIPIQASPSNGLAHDSFADAFQVKSVAAERFVQKRGILSQAELDEIATVIAHCVGYVPPKPKVEP
jgi:mRNA interferase MazF